MRIRPRFFIGGGLIVLAIGYLIFSSIRTTSEYYLTVPEVAARQTENSADRRFASRAASSRATSHGIRIRSHSI